MNTKAKTLAGNKNRKLPLQKVSDGEPIELEEEEDPCIPKDQEPTQPPVTFVIPGQDPRFQQQNQTMRCYVMYTDHFQCKHLLGDEHEACKWFKDVYTAICPMEWVERWDDYREENRMPWFKRAPFPKYAYGRK